MPNVPKTAPTGYYGLLPNEGGTYDVTVVSFGGASPLGIGIAGLHVVTWIAAIVLSFIARFGGNLDSSSDTVKLMSLVQAICALLSFVATALHSAFVDKDFRTAPLSGVFLLFVILFTILLSGANLAVTALMTTSDAYNMQVFASLLVVLASSMVISFYINFTHLGKRTTTRGSSAAAAGSTVPPTPQNSSV